MERAAEMTGTPATTESAPPPPDLPAIRSRVLAGLKLGRQAPGYKAAAKALAAFEEALEERFPKTYRAPETQEEGP
ncbi:hypothetical protein [Kamptonema formosum]|uniref:hypothetical protein n=1 Tax=Kamptonema formosum TaxID=331992 RepID=UPI0003483E39|nr:hypothetical protein [Oscillatoria sp. PCC 10802]